MPRQRTTPITNATCAACGMGFYVFPSRISVGWGKYCSSACRGIVKRASLQACMDALVTRGQDGECWPWTGPSGDYGYGRFKHAGRRYAAHRVAWEIANGREIPSGLVARHRCHNRRCCNPSHITIGTVAENNADTVEAGRHVRGEACHTAKLTPATVVAIRNRAASGEGCRRLAREFGLAKSTVTAIISGATWKHVP